MKEPVKVTSKTVPRFSVEQVEFLEGIFREVTSSGQSYADLQYQAGQRSVLMYIKQIAKIGIRHVQREVLQKS